MTWRHAIFWVNWFPIPTVTFCHKSRTPPPSDMTLQFAYDPHPAYIINLLKYCTVLVVQNIWFSTKWFFAADRCRYFTVFTCFTKYLRPCSNLRTCYLARSFSDDKVILCYVAYASDVFRRPFGRCPICWWMQNIISMPFLAFILTFKTVLQSAPE